MGAPSSTRLLLVGAAVVALAGEVSAQGDPVGSGFRTLRGVVLTDDALREPVSRARVSASWTDGRSDPVFTDCQGRFEITVRTSVFHTLEVSKAGYAPRKEPRESQTTDEAIEVALTRGAVITGVVVDPNGEPVVGVGILVRRTDPSGTTYGAGEYLTDTDDRGEFRVGSLPAGPYAVVISRMTPGSGSSGPVVSRAGVVMNGAVNPDTVVRMRAGEETSVTRVYERPTASVASVRALADGVNVGGRTPYMTSQRTSAIRGRVLDAQKRPVAGAIVRAFPVSPGDSSTSSTDAQGRYELWGLFPGTYRVMAVDLSGGALEIPEDRPGTLITVRSSEEAGGVDILLPNGGVMRGLVLDEYGEPLEGLTVDAWQARWREGRLIIGPVAGPIARRTDDRGRYRLYGLREGSYYPVVVRAPRGTEMPDGALFDSLVPETSGPRQVFYPGVASPTGALSVEVHDGRELSGLDIAVQPVRLARVRGRVVDSGGAEIAAAVTLAGSARSGHPVLPTRRTNAIGGVFDFANVAPGDYVVRAVITDSSDSGAPNSLSLRTTKVLEVATAFVKVAEEDVDPVSLQGSPGTTLRGKVILEGGLAAATSSGMTLHALSADPDFSFGRTAQVSPDGSFEMTGLFGPTRFVVISRLTALFGPTEVKLNATTPPLWLRLASLEIDGVNAADEPVTLGPAGLSRDDVEAIVTKDGAEISGSVSGVSAARRAPVVLIFPTDARRWFGMSPFLRLVTVDRDGRFEAAQMPAAEYVVVAVDAERIGNGEDWKNPELLARVAPLGRRVTVRPNGRAMVEIGGASR